MSVLPFDLTEFLLTELRRNRRPNDGLLHASSHLTGSLRHAQLDVMDAPRIESELLSEITLMTGTMWHNFMHDALRRQGVPYMAEVNMTPWMPAGWGGTLDGLFLDPGVAFTLADFKTTKGESLRYILRDGAKDEHVWQTSIYWHAAKLMLASAGKLKKVIAVYYLPKNDTRSKDEIIEPVLMDFEPIPLEKIMTVAQERAEAVNDYRLSLPEKRDSLDAWVTEQLAPEQPRVQTIYHDRKTGTYDVKLKPHWSATYCPYPPELCNCSAQGETKLGYYDSDGTYYPRDGFEDIEPEVAP